MLEIKAIFDADILIHIIKSQSIHYVLKVLDYIYISEYVYNKEIIQSSIEGKVIQNLIKSKKIIILKESDLNNAQMKAYKSTYKLLKQHNVENEERNPINEGERITAAFANAFNVYYYMSDDNTAAPHIKSLTNIDIVNFCDILFIYLQVYGKNELDNLRYSYDQFIKLYDSDKIPRIIRNRDGIKSFIDMMGYCFDRFMRNENLKSLLQEIRSRKQIEPEVAVTTEKEKS